MSTKSIHISSDLLGALSSGLCLIHCLATPFLFIAKSCSTSCCADAPLVWSMIDFIFIGVSFFAVKWSVKTTPKGWIKIALWIAWTASFISILDEKFSLLQLPQHSIYYSAFLLIGFHLYNNKYCKCNEDSCCTKM